MSTRIRVDVSDLFGLAAELSNAASVINTGAARAVNIVTTETRLETVKRITSQVNLKPSYVESKLKVAQDATAERPTAIIEAPVDGVFIDRYDGQQMAQANVWTPAMYAEKFGSLDAVTTLPNSGQKTGIKKRIGWDARTGDRSFGRGIAPGAKSAGISVTIKAGSGAKTISYAFLLPLKRGKELGPGIGAFKRPKGGGKAKAIKSLSVDQMSKIVWRQDADKITKALGDKVLAEVTADITKELKL